MTHTRNYRVDKTKHYRIKTVLEGIDKSDKPAMERTPDDEKLNYVTGHIAWEASIDGQVHEVAIVSDLTGETYYVSPRDIEVIE